jgi:hypothetical protein
MTSVQLKVFESIIAGVVSKMGTDFVFHHGDCHGADKQAHELVRKRYPKAYIALHLPDAAHKRAWCEGDLSYRPKPYLERNHDIVESSHIMFATPAEREEKLRSGTWATVRHSRKKKVPVIIVFPDGRVLTENRTTDGT